MRILVLSHFYPPEGGAAAARVSELSQAWARAGHRVTVLTGFPHYPTGVIAPSHRRQFRRFTARETHGKVSVIRTWVLPSSTARTRLRMASYVSFFLSALLRGAILPKADVVVATSPHLLTPMAGYLLARQRRAAFVMDVRDLWPESLTGSGVVREDGLSIRLLERVARFLYDHSDAIVCVTERQRSTLLDQHGLPEAKVHVVENGVEEDTFLPMQRSAAREALPVEVPGGLAADRFVIVYVGTLAQAHGVEVLAEVARILRRQLPSALLLVVGDGAGRKELEDAVAQDALGNVCFVGLRPREEIPVWIGASDVGLATFRPAAVFETVIPVKLIELMACGRAVVVAVPGLAAELVEEAGSGLAVEPGNASAIAEALIAMANSPDRRRMERAGRALVLARFRRTELAKRYACLLEQVGGQRRSTTRRILAR